MEAVHLSATSYYVPGSASMDYLNYGAAVSEVSLFLLPISSYVLNLGGIFSSS